MEWRQCGWGWMNNVHWTLTGNIYFLLLNLCAFYTYQIQSPAHLVSSSNERLFTQTWNMTNNLQSWVLFENTKIHFFLIPGFDNTNDITLCKCHILQDWGMKPVLNCFLCWWIIWRLSLRVQWTLFSEHCSPFPSSKSKRLVNTHYISDTISTFIANHHQGKLEMCKIVSAFIGRFFTSAISW